MTSYIEITFACAINWMMFTTQGDTYNYGVLINNVFLCLSSLMLVGYPVWLYFFLKKNYFDLHLPALKVKYENVYENMQLYDNEEAIWLPILYCIRRFVLAMTCCCLIGYPVF
jgi:hypothetical protein